MAITIHIYYTGKNQDAKKFAKEMVDSGLVHAIRNEEGNLQYQYFYSIEDPETILLIDCWKDQAALDFHHHSKMMTKIATLRNKYNLIMKVQRFIDDPTDSSQDEKYIQKGEIQHDEKM